MPTLRPTFKITLLCITFLVIGFVIGAAVTDRLQDRYNRASALAAGYMAMDSFKQHDTDRALAFVHQSITLNPDNYSGYFFLGDIYASEGKSTLALEMYQKALTKTYNENASFFDFGRKVKPAEYDRKRIQEKINRMDK